MKLQSDSRHERTIRVPRADFKEITIGCKVIEEREECRKYRKGDEEDTKDPHSA